MREPALRAIVARIEFRIRRLLLGSALDRSNRARGDGWTCVLRRELRLTRRALHHFGLEIGR